MQNEPGVDEDIDVCWDCIDDLLPGEDHETQAGVAAEEEGNQEDPPADRGDESSVGPAETSGE